MFKNLTFRFGQSDVIHVRFKSGHTAAGSSIISDDWTDVICVNALIIIPAKLFPFIISNPEQLSSLEEVTGAFGFSRASQESLPSRSCLGADFIFLCQK